MKRLWSKTLSTLWQETMKYTITTCRCKFGKSNKKQMCDVHKDEKICYRNFSRSKSSSWKSARNFVDEMISDVWRRNEQPYKLRTELTPQTLHHEDVTQHQSQPYAGLHQHWTRLVDTTTSRNVWRISGCSFSHWIRNWTTSTKTRIASTRITTPQQRQSKCWCSSPNEPDKFGLGLDESNLSISSAVVISCFSQELTYKRLFRCIRHAHCWYLVGELGQSPLHTNMRWMFGLWTQHPNADANLDTNGTTCDPIEDLTHDDIDTKSHMSDTPLQLPANVSRVEQFSSGHALTSKTRSRAKCSVFNRYKIKKDWILGNCRTQLHVFNVHV